MLEMGILDALIVPKEYREQVYALDKGVCDRYLFSDVAHVRESLQEVLEVENGENDILFYQNISNILSAIGFGDTHAEHGDSWIDANGNYRIGVLEGTITGEYQARFIGVRAREKYRKEKIEELTGLCEQLRASVEDLEKQLAENRARTETLQAEWKSFPGEEDLKTAAKEFSDREYKLERKNKRLWEHQELAEKEEKHWMRYASGYGRSVENVIFRQDWICLHRLFWHCTDIKKFFPSFRLRMASIKIVSGIS